MYQICVSGSAKGDGVEMGKRLGDEIGEIIAKEGHALLTGATTGIPHTAAKAYKKAGGLMSIGLSPAASKIEHIMKYHLPTRPFDVILYTGMHYVGRDELLINSSDGVISIGGRLGTLHEATIAIETSTPIAFLDGAGGTGGLIKDIVKISGEKVEKVIYGDNPKELFDQLIAIIDEEHEGYVNLYEHE